MTDTGCQQCEANTYSDTGASSCTECPDGKISNAGSTSAENCYHGNMMANKRNLLKQGLILKIFHVIKSKILLWSFFLTIFH